MDQSIVTPSAFESFNSTSMTTFAAQRSEMVALIERHCVAVDRQETAVPGLVLFRGCVADKQTCAVVNSAFAMIAQGAKRILVGDQVHDYDTRHYMIASVELPVSSRVTIASPAEPYLGLAISIDPLKIAELVTSIPKNGPKNMVDRGFGVGTLDVDIQGAALRLLRLLDTPDDIPVLAPMIERELLYRLLTGHLGSLLQQVVTAGSHSQQIVRAIDWLKNNLAKTVTIDYLADLANMSKSSLHHHFRALTSMTPVQYQKQLRLHEARRLMLSDRHDAASAAHRVGYESPSQFSREYRRLFGYPPGRDVAQLMAAGAPVDSVSG